MNIYKTIYKPTIVDRKAKKVGLFCNARDEKNIKEWAAHHLLIGFDVIVLIDHKSKIPLKEVFANFDKRVKIIRTEKEGGNMKLFFMNNVTNIAKNLQLDWFIYLDADEFLILNNKFRGVKHFLNTYSYGDLVGINWLVFGSNYFIEDPDGLMIENYTRSSLYLNEQVKSFVRPTEVTFADNPHYYYVKNPSRMIGINFKRLTKPYYHNNLQIPFYKAPAYVAHYVYQSEETYKKRKVDFKIADDGTTRLDLGKEIHNHGNEGINTQPQKYINPIKEFLQYYD
jgi:hypothetical protein